MLRTAVTGMLKVNAAVILPALVVALVLVILVALDVWIFHVPLSTR